MNANDSAAALASELRRLQPQRYLDAFLQQNVRHNGRQFLQAREVDVDTGSISTANGSALVRMGGTTVVCGITAEVAEPDLLRPNAGFLVPNVELPSLASPDFRSGPPSDQAQMLSDRLRSCLLSSSVVPLSSLCIEPGRSAWVLYIDVVCLNYSGNLFDALFTAVMAALRDVKLPQIQWDVDDEQTYEVDGERRSLKMMNSLQSSTFALINNTLISDPDDFEESHCRTFITVLLDEKGATKQLWHIGPSLTGNTQKSLISQCTLIARQRLPLYLKSMQT